MSQTPTQQTSSQTKNRFDRFKNYAAGSLPTISSSVDELTRYLRDPPEQTTNPLQWWYERRQSYPNLSCMARDYLSIPGEYL